MIRIVMTELVCRLALEMELINCQGKTPDATMASALYTDVKRKVHLSVFTRPQVNSLSTPEHWLCCSMMRSLVAIALLPIYVYIMCPYSGIYAADTRRNISKASNAAQSSLAAMAQHTHAV